MKNLIDNFYFPISIYYLLIIFFVWGLIWLVLHLSQKNFEKVRKAITPNISILIFSIGLTFSILGFTIGLLSSLSRAPNIEAIIPALLTLIGGLISYSILKDNDNKISLTQSSYIFISIISLCFFLIYGSGIGSYYRAQHEVRQKKLDIYLEKDLEEYKKELDTYHKKSLEEFKQNLK